MNHTETTANACLFSSLSNLVEVGNIVGQNAAEIQAHITETSLFMLVSHKMIHLLACMNTFTCRT